MTEMFGEAWSPMSVPDLAPDDDDDDCWDLILKNLFAINPILKCLELDLFCTT